MFHHIIKNPDMDSDRKVQILDAAERLFSERGYHATSMRDLAAALDLKGGSLYSHISGKEELLWRVLQRAAERFGAAIDPFVTSNAPARERLRGAMAAHMRVITGNLNAATVYFHEWKVLAEPQRTEFKARRDEYEGRLRALMQAAISESGTEGQIDPKWATLLLLSSANWLYQWYDPDGPLSADEIATRFTDMLFTGLLNPTDVPMQV